MHLTTMSSVLRGLVVEVACGLHPWERHPERPNRLVVDVELFGDFTVLRRDGAIIDYDNVRNYLKTWRDRPHTPLLETLLYDLLEVCFSDPKVQSVRASLTKPDIFGEAEGAGIAVHVDRATFFDAASR